MAQPTFDQLFNDPESVVTSATYNTGTNTLTVVFGQTVTASQGWISIVQSGQRWLVTNTDLTVNIAATAISQFTTSRNSVDKLQTSFTIQAFTPNNNSIIDPLQV